MSYEEQVDAREVAVHLVDVEVPRLSPLIPEDAKSSYQRALEVTREVIGPYPELVVDLERGYVAVNSRKLPLSQSCLLWLAALALHRQDSEASDGWLPVADTPRVRLLLDRVRETMWLDLPADSTFAQILGIGMARVHTVGQGRRASQEGTRDNRGR